MSEYVSVLHTHFCPTVQQESVLGSLLIDIV